MFALLNNVQALRLRPHIVSRRSDSDLGASDQEILLAAIASRLRTSVDRESQAPGAMRTLVHECAGALEQLRPGLAHERSHIDRVEHELREARAELAAAHVELAGTRDGERRALHLADHDALTALPNRHCFHNRLEQALARKARVAGSANVGASLAVLFLDLDDFKPVNDRHGHQTGDELLRIVAQRLSRAVRAEDMVCRLGGDEFACLLATAMTPAQLCHVASKLFDAVSAPLKVGRLELTVRPSIGIAICPDHGDTAAALLRHADTAMYRAKRRQLGYSFFDARVDA